MTRLARFKKLLQTALMALMRDHKAALESLRSINRELLIIAFAEVPAGVAEKCDEARGSVLDAIRLLDPVTIQSTINVEELPPKAYRKLVAGKSKKFHAITNPPGQN